MVSILFRYWGGPKIFSAELSAALDSDEAFETQWALDRLFKEEAAPIMPVREQNVGLDEFVQRDGNKCIGRRREKQNQVRAIMDQCWNLKF